MAGEECYDSSSHLFLSDTGFAGRLYHVQRSGAAGVCLLSDAACGCSGWDIAVAEAPVQDGSGAGKRCGGAWGDCGCTFSPGQ